MAKDDDDELDDDLDEDEDDEDESDDDDGDDGDDDISQVDKSTLLEEIADVLADVYQEATEVDFDDGKEKILITMSDGSKWEVTARRVD